MTAAKQEYPSWMPRRFNACTDPCDAWSGPCACGAWHNGSDHVELLKQEIAAGLYRREDLSEQARAVFGL